MFFTVRVLVGFIAALIFLGGLGVAIAGGPSGATVGIWPMLGGGGLLIAVLLERSRYRSQAADRASDAVGPGGGEIAGTLEPRFRWTEEVFRDPTSGRRMRVYLDPRTGERRYRAED